jgi:uncharacterized protein YjbI with pentapeptide repeats
MFAIQLSLYVGLAIITLTFGQINEFEKCLQNGSLLTSNICRNKNYPRTVIPSKPLDLKIIITLQDVRDLDEVDLSMSTRMMWTFQWPDKRLITNSNNLTESPTAMDPSSVKQIWLPDSFIKDLIKFEGTSTGQFQNIQVRNSQFQNSQFRNSQFQNSQYQNSQFQISQFQNSQFQNSQFQSSQFQNSQFDKVYVVKLQHNLESGIAILVFCY